MGKKKKDFEETISPEVEARENEIIARFTAGLLDLARRKLGFLSKATKLANLSSGYLYRLQRGERHPGFATILRILASTEIPLEAFLRRLLELEWAGKPGIERNLTGPPAQLLAEWREPGPFQGSELLAQLAPWLDEITLLPLAGPAEPSKWRLRLLELEEERLRDWRQVRRKLERRILWLARRLARQEQVPPVRLADLGTLVAAWAAAHRTGGLSGLAIDGFLVAFPLVERSKDLWAESFCLVKAAHLSMTLGHNEMGVAMINKAAVGFSEVGGEEDLARLAIDRGVIYYQAGELLTAQRLLEAGLHRLGPERRQYRAAAHFSLARILRQYKDFDRARKELERAIELHDPSSVEAGYMAWEAARFELESRDFPLAEPLLRKALNLFARLGCGEEIAVAALDYAELLFRTRRTAELKNLIREVLGWLAPLSEANRTLLKPFENLWAEIVLGSLSLVKIGNVREQFHKRAIAQLRADSYLG